MQRELGEEDEARMLDVLSRTVSDQEVVSVQANQLSLFHVLVTQNFVNRCMTVPSSLIFFCSCETHLSQVMVFGDRTEDVRKFDCFQVFHISWNTKSALVCSETQTFQCRGTITEESKIPIA